MNTLLIALSAVLGQAADSPAPQWQQNYAQAEQMASRENKNVAVFLVPGKNAMNQLVQGGLSDRAREILASSYIPVKVDTTMPEGQRLARQFEVRQGQGIVLSDRGGARQAFWSQGNMTSQELERNLEKYANQTNVQITEVAGRSSLYPPMDDQGNPARQTNQSQRRFRLFPNR